MSWQAISLKRILASHVRSPAASGKTGTGRRGTLAPGEDAIG
jgi:hypothetical protein